MIAVETDGQHEVLLSSEATTPNEALFLAQEEHEEKIKEKQKHHGWGRLTLLGGGSLAAVAAAIGISIGATVDVYNQIIDQAKTAHIPLLEVHSADSVDSLVPIHSHIDAFAVSSNPFQQGQLNDIVINTIGNHGGTIEMAGLLGKVGELGLAATILGGVGYGIYRFANREK